MVRDDWHTEMNREEVLELNWFVPAQVCARILYPDWGDKFEDKVMVELLDTEYV